METQYITLSHDRARTVIHAVQGESCARKLVFTLLNSASEQLQFSSEHKAFFYVDAIAQIGAEIDTASNTISVILPVQATADSGDHICTLQIYTSEEDLWRGDLLLKVERNPAARIPEKREFLTITKILQNAENIERLLEKSQETKELFEGTLDKYIDGISPELTGKIQRVDPEAGIADGNGIAFDTNGNLLWLDGCKHGAVDTKISFDNGKSWIDAPLQSEETDIFDLCVGGERFLCLSKNKLLWARVSGNQLVVESQFNNPLKTNVSPQHAHGKYLNGKYWVFRNAGSAVYPPAYFTGNEAAYATVTLPNTKMEAHDIAYDPESGDYYMVGGYDAYSSESYNGWLARSTDLVEWEILHAWNSYAHHKYKLSLQGGTLTIFSQGNGGLNIRRLNLKDEEWEETSVAVSSDFQLTSVISSAFGVFVIEEEAFAFSKNGIDFSIFSVSFPAHYNVSAAAAVFGRRLIVTNGPQYAVFRVDLAGEKLIQTLENAREAYKELESNLEAVTEQAGSAAQEATQQADYAKTQGDRAAEAADQINRIDVAGHIADTTLHLTEDEKASLARPYWVSVYKGTGNANRTAVAPAEARAIIVLCGDHPATVHREDGKTDVYWDFWSIGDSQRDYLGMGGVESKKGSRQWIAHSMNSKKDENLVFHLNDANTYYLALFVPTREELT